MKEFIENLKKELDISYNTQETENGAVGYKTTNNPLLDLNFKVSSYRNADESQIIKDFQTAFINYPELTLKWLFFARDVRGGLGERRLFRIIFNWLSNQKSFQKEFEYLFPLVPEYGRFDDTFAITNENNLLKVIKYFSDKLKEEYETKIPNGDKISLLAKWMPSINCSNKKRKELANRFRQMLKLSPKQYRLMLSQMRQYIDVLERKLVNKDWASIDYSTVPSKANIKYEKAFLRNDEKRRNEFIETALKGEAKINASTNYPHDIVHMFNNGQVNVFTPNEKAYVENETAEALWKNLKKYPLDGNTLVVVDGSASMDVPIQSNSSITSREIANAMAIYFSELNKGALKDKFITFSANPKFIDISKGKTLYEKFMLLMNYQEVANTDIEAVFNLILDTAINNKMTQEDLPKNILVISDMEFDSGTTPNSKDPHLFEQIKDKYTQNGYKIPRVIFHNVNSRTKAIPMIENDLGVLLLSGFSPSIVDMILSGELDAFECLKKFLNKDRYKQIEIKEPINAD